MIVVMGGVSSSSSSKGSETKGGSNSSNRLSVVGQKLPMPDHNELEQRFSAVLASMNLPPDKARLLKSYDDERKWDLVCDKERVSAKDSPESYINKLRLYLDPLSSKDTKNLKNLVGNTLSTKMLKELEISLRTNHIEWVHCFLCEENNGLDVLVDYLTLTQEDMRFEQESNVGRRPSSVGDLNGGRVNSMLFMQNSMQSLTLTRNSRRYTSRRQSTSKVRFGDATDDVHVCIMCLRAIMNHQNGFNLVFGHKQAINCIALSLNHQNFRTKTLVLELLAAICLVSGGHEMILAAFDNFKKVCGETHRFETLMRHFRNLDEFHIDFMVACMQFINIIVHSVQEMNFRVHLQHEFTLLGLDHFLERLKNTESDCLPVQVHAYLDNMIDVQLLLEDSDTKSAALSRVEELGDMLSHANERIQELDEIYLAKTVQMQEQLSEVTKDRDRLVELCEQLKKETQGRKSLHLTDSVIDVPSSPLIAGPTSVDLPPPPPSAPVPVAPPPAPPAAPPPPPFPSAPTGFASMPPPPLPPIFPGLPGAPVISIKKSIQPKYRLPILNWIAMKPNDVKGTMFSEIDDEKLYDVIDFNQFEDFFKIGNLSFVDTDIDSVRKAPTKKEKLSLLESNRLRNVAITRRKIEMLDSEIVKSINGLDLKVLSLECVEILLRIIPNEQEVKAFKEYEKEKKPIDQLADEDRFMINLMKIERVGTKLQIMSFIGNFFDTCHHLSPQLQAVFSASKSIRNSMKIQQLFEIILAFGNYMNGCKRGGVYGFKLQSLDMLSEMKSSDKKMSLLQFIVKTIQEKFPSLANFDVDFDYAEKAATVSLENVIGDISELERGMEMTKREYEQRKDRDPPVILKDFLSNSEDKLRRLNVDAKNAREAYSKVVEYFGENPKMTAPSTFFSLFVRFCKAYKQSEIDLETMARLEREALISKTTAKNKKTVKESRDAVVNELQYRQRQVLNRDEINDGTLDDIINNIKTKPYRRADAMHRSMRRAADTNVRPIVPKCAC